MHKVTFKETFSDVASGLFSFEAPFWRTLKLLFVNPGRLFREYLAGKRKSYFKPVSFFILLTVAHLLIRSLLDYDPMGDIPDDPNARVNLFREAGQFMVQHINNILFVFVFTLSLFMKLFFYKKYSWAEYMAIAFYLVGIYIFLGTIHQFFLKFLDSKMQFLTMVIMLLYFVYAMISLFQKKKFLVGFQALCAYVFGTIFYVILGFGLALLIVYFS
ncbi:DUF3667 domain-containing protein [Aureisphaera galaxeae]|uniref:DUF3667 domain-containing protein n=1 Tax=Aureisphaera galaxeae TaxID=1538023 RepID=UPI00234FE1C7|nr:DUF3667 domain-containing protein [Aureisphaera galaxeae]MDC8002873.1 DUF3667 domain-containing protein [Aureisphaera galaxeae]